ncbi:MAG TPA: helix-turn-helix transcriptional regulator [Pyrinomonadaceae bacterium]
MSSEQPKRLAEKLRRIRETLAHTPEVMARHLDLKVADIERFESGEVPPLPVLLHWARMGYVTVESLIDDGQDAVVGATKRKGRDYERPFFCAKRALVHSVNKNHELKTTCAGCAEIIGFVEMPGYDGDKHNPVGVDFDRPY